MAIVYRSLAEKNGWQEHEGCEPDVTWIDAISPNTAELSALDALMGFEVPNRHDMTGIELSSRLYEEDDAFIMIANLLPRSGETMSPPRPAAFILKENLLLTIRFSEFHSFDRVAKKALPLRDRDAASTFCRLLEEAVGDRADSLEYSMRTMEELTSQLFLHSVHTRTGPASVTTELDEALRRIGCMGEHVANVRESITSLQRVVNYAVTYLPKDQVGENREVLVSMKTDLAALSDEAGFFMNKLNFNLDAVLGMINIEESKVIRLLSIVTLLLSPPTLIAGIYGMNFDIMPELHWPFGYTFALGLMALTAVGSIIFLKRRHWM